MFQNVEDPQQDSIGDLLEQSYMQEDHAGLHEASFPYNDYDQYYYSIFEGPQDSFEPSPHKDTLYDSLPNSGPQPRRHAFGGEEDEFETHSGYPRQRYEEPQGDWGMVDPRHPAAYYLQSGSASESEYLALYGASELFG